MIPRKFPALLSSDFAKHSAISIGLFVAVFCLVFALPQPSSSPSRLSTTTTSSSSSSSPLLPSPIIRSRTALQTCNVGGLRSLLKSLGGFAHPALAVVDSFSASPSTAAPASDSSSYSSEDLPFVEQHRVLTLEIIPEGTLLASLPDQAAMLPLQNITIRIPSIPLGMLHRLDEESDEFEQAARVNRSGATSLQWKRTKQEQRTAALHDNKSNDKNDNSNKQEEEVVMNDGSGFEDGDIFTKYFGEYRHFAYKSDDDGSVDIDAKTKKMCDKLRGDKRVECDKQRKAINKDARERDIMQKAASTRSWGRNKRKRPAERKKYQDFMKKQEEQFNPRGNNHPYTRTDAWEKAEYMLTLSVHTSSAQSIQVYKLAARLLQELDRIETSPYRDYLNCLPKECKSLFCLDREYLVALHDEFLVDQILNDRRRIILVLDLISWREEVGLDYIPNVVDWIWAVSIVLSRGVYLNGVPRLLPFLDMFNHGESERPLEITVYNAEEGATVPFDQWSTAVFIASMHEPHKPKKKQRSPFLSSPPPPPEKEEEKDENGLPRAIFWRKMSRTRVAANTEILTNYRPLARTFPATELDLLFCYGFVSGHVSHARMPMTLEWTDARGNEITISKMIAAFARVNPKVVRHGVSDATLQLTLHFRLDGTIPDETLSLFRLYCQLTTSLTDEISVIRRLQDLIDARLDPSPLRLEDELENLLRPHPVRVRELLRYRIVRKTVAIESKNALRNMLEQWDALEKNNYGEEE